MFNGYQLFDKSVNCMSTDIINAIKQGDRYTLVRNGCKFEWMVVPALSSISTSNGIQGNGTPGDPIRLNIPGLPNQLTYDPAMTIAVRNPTTNQHEEILASLLIPTITKYTPAGIIANANTNPAFPTTPTVGDAREITTTNGTVGGLSVNVGDLLVYGLSGWFVLNGANESVDTLADLLSITTDYLGNVRLVRSTGDQYRWDGTNWIKLGDMNFFFVTGTSYTAQNKDFILTKNTTAISTVTLPPANTKWVITVKKSNNSIFSTFVVPSGTDLIDGDTSAEIAYENTAVTFYSDGLGNIHIV